MANYQTVTQMYLGQSAMTTSLATVYTAPVNTLTNVLDITVTNTGAAVATFDVYLVPAAGTAGTSNALFYQCPLQPKQTVQWTGNQTLSAGWTIQTKASTTGLTANFSGEQFV
jgi:hypothetical protein